jgi:hypothetical protein
MDEFMRRFLLLVLVLLSACATEKKQHDREFATLLAQLPGRYDNLQQVQVDAASARSGAHAAEALLIVRLHAPLVGDQVFLVRETAADDERRVTSERIWSLEQGPDGQIVTTVARIEEPDRWRGGAENPDLFRSLLMRDIHAIAGCRLDWKKSAQGFSADGLPGGCRRGGDGGSVMTQHWRLSGDGVALAESAAPRPLADDDPSYYRFLRRAGSSSD